ncbi:MULTISPECIES: hypothetical protein [unclassified Marinobacter]|uniref:hypothetical protein n=1 Tax=unclassified Marinobacter TaxID=83889 RepID=UPI0012A9BF53|nr:MULTISPECIES: hypothetical protein [unclassified Marinobacter]QFS87595.1 hypothetical protein FIV08_12250 [Marinobacter sp. THAF197a]QFT51380.1 hypothetical protein FIU96_12165 [Marinobacter sp. THAF39]
MEEYLKLLLKELSSSFNTRVELKDDEKTVGLKIGRREVLEFLEGKLESLNVFENT